MIQRSGSSARKRLPMSAATSRTWATSFLSSVSGIVKNWGACGSMAPPITVDSMAVSPCWTRKYRCHAGTTSGCASQSQAKQVRCGHQCCAIQGALMVGVPITIACGNYDRTRAIMDGRVRVEGCAVTYLPLYPEEIFHRAFKFQEFDVSELSFSSYLRTVENLL